MGALISFLLLPILVVLILILFFGIFAYAKIMKMWYQLTGRKPKNGSFFHFNTGSGSSWYTTNGNPNYRNDNAQNGRNQSFATSLFQGSKRTEENLLEGRRRICGF